MARSLLIPLFLLSFLAPAAGQDEVPPIGWQEGRMAPDFQLPTVDGESLRLSDYRGHKVIVFHFASW